jgi:hypothetical protein
VGGVIGCIEEIGFGSEAKIAAIVLAGKPDAIQKRSSGRSIHDLLEADFWPAKV